MTFFFLVWNVWLNRLIQVNEKEQASFLKINMPSLQERRASANLFYFNIVETILWIHIIPGICISDVVVGYMGIASRELAGELEVMDAVFVILLACQNIEWFIHQRNTQLPWK
ncbi:hypothetical protein ACJX0J_024391, partial [Zea mays]